MTHPETWDLEVAKPHVIQVLNWGLGRHGIIPQITDSSSATSLRIYSAIHDEGRGVNIEALASPNYLYPPSIAISRNVLTRNAKQTPEMSDKMTVNSLANPFERRGRKASGLPFL